MVGPTGRNIAVGVAVVMLLAVWGYSTYGKNWLTGGPSDHEIMCGKLSDAMDNYPPVSDDAKTAILSATRCL